MAVCEDAPCCGCCGPAVWAAEAASEEEAYWDRLNSPEWDEWEDEEEDEWDEEDPGAEDAHLDSYMEARLMGEG